MLYIVRRAKRHFYVQFGDKGDAVTIEQLKPIHSDGPVLPALLKKLGRHRKMTESLPLLYKTTETPKKRGRARKTMEIAPSSLSERKKRTFGSRKTIIPPKDTDMVVKMTFGGPKQQGMPPKLPPPAPDPDRWTLV